MKSQIIYGSQYGTTRRYAESFAQMTGLPVTSCDDLGDLSGCGLAVHFGALYAGGVKGLRQTLKALPQGAALYLVTVGLADPRDPENTANILRSIRSQLPEQVMARTEVFHLRGGIDYSKLSFLHKTMMGLLYKKAKGLPQEKQSAETRAMIETYNKKVDFVELDALLPIAEAVRRGR